MNEVKNILTGIGVVAASVWAIAGLIHLIGVSQGDFEAGWWTWVWAAPWLVAAAALILSIFWMIGAKVRGDWD